MRQTRPRSFSRSLGAFVALALLAVACGDDDGNATTGGESASCAPEQMPDAVEAEDAVRNREAVAAFFLPPTDAARIRGVIDRGERLPRKSTFFWPKPRTGLVLRPLDLDATE